ncbi:hypothetical protein BGX27_005129 [Mortierella sp. AM989]|nr:hypothetical protein BGX27_005129 [Mortierella sp. AM989]
MANIQALKQRNIKSDNDSKAAKEAFYGADSKHSIPPIKVHSAFSPLKTILRAWAIFVGFLAVIIAITYQLHYALPTPVNEPLDSVSGHAQFSEANVRKIVRHLSEDIGYRVVGTEQELDSKKYLIKELSQLKEDARIGSLRKPVTDMDQAWPNFDMWVQVGDGSHRFDFMSKGK